MSGGAIAGGPRAASRRRRLLIENLWAYAFLLPAFAVLFLFKVLPAIYAVYISTFKWDIIQGAFRGIENYTDVLFGSRAEAWWRERDGHDGGIGEVSRIIDVDPMPELDHLGPPPDERAALVGGLARMDDRRGQSDQTGADPDEPPDVAIEIEDLPWSWD